MMSRHIYYVLSSFWHLTFTFVPQQKISNRSWCKSRLINLSGEWRLTVHWLQRAAVCIASQVINKMVEEKELGYIILYKLKNLKKSCAYAFAFCLVFLTLFHWDWQTPGIVVPSFFSFFLVSLPEIFHWKNYQDKRLKLSEQIFLSPRGSNQSPSACETKAITMRYLDIWLVASNSVARIRLWCILLFPHSLTVHPVVASSL